MSATQENTSRTITRRWKLADGAATGTPAVLIETGEHPSAGLLLVELALRGLEATNVRIERGETLPPAESVGFTVVLGTDELTDELDPSLINWIAAADSAGAAIFAIGTGAQALARALGGDSVTSADPGLTGAGSRFAWNDHSLVLPAGAELISETDGDPQAFRIGRHVGVRFHPDTTPELIREWVPRHRQLFDLNEATVYDFPAVRPAEHRLFAAFIDEALAA